MALLELTDISKSFGGVQALRNVDFTLNAGEIHGLAGENGAGKSTMMKIISGVHLADSGIMRVDGGGAPDTPIDSTIVAGNTKNAAVLGDTDLDGAFTGSFDLVQNLGGATLAGSSNILGQDPQLGPLASNGGLTQTRKPAQTSPAIDKGSASGLTTDQRGAAFARTFDVPSIANAGDGTDIGAVELQATEAPQSPAATPPSVQTPPRKKCRKRKAKKHSASAAKHCKKKKRKR